MSFTKINRSAATLTKNRTEGSISPFSGMCVTCVDGCIGMCEIGKSRLPRGRGPLSPALRHHHRGLGEGLSLRPVPFQHHGHGRRRLRRRSRQRQGDLREGHRRDADRPRQVHQAGRAVRRPRHGLDQRRQAELGRPGHRRGHFGRDPDHRRERRGHGRGLGDQERNRVLHSPDMANRVKLFKDWQTTATARSSSSPTSRTRASASRNTPSTSSASKRSSSSGARAPRTSAARSRSRA